MQLIKFNPLKEITTIENEIQGMLNDGWDWIPEVAPYSTLDMYEEAGWLVTEVSLLQFKKKEIEVAIDSSGIEITANHTERKSSDGDKKRRYYRQESSQNYWRRINLPITAEWSKAEATFEDGMLTVKVPIGGSRAKKLLKVK